MTADEIAGATRRYRERIEALLTAEQLAHYDRFQARVAAAIAARSAERVETTPEERAVLEVIDADSAARGLRAQLDILTGVEASRQ